MTQVQQVQHYCRKCQRSVSKWVQNCPHCKAFNSIAQGKPESGSHAYQDEVPEKLSEVQSEKFSRISTGTKEFDRVLGGGLVTDSAVLIAGDPGIGKSTLLTQVLIDLTTAEAIDDETGEPGEPFVVLYVCAEETKSQVKIRADRLARGARELFLYRQVNIKEIESYIDELDPDVVVIDSIQKMMDPDIDGHAGGVVQVRECGKYIIGICKMRRIATFIVCHITKDGDLAGPKTLEHDVDVVLEFHKEGTGDLRSLRARKNRFGDTNEMALFKMSREGLVSIENPSELLLEHHQEGKPGLCVALAADGPRPMAIEIQTLLSGIVEIEEAFDEEVLDLLESLRQRGDEEEYLLLSEALKKARKKSIPMRRHVTGLDSKRVNQVLAVLTKRCKAPVEAYETFCSIAGGIEMKDPGLDLPVALALTSYALDTALPKSFCAFGEIGLGGEIRSVAYLDARIKNAMLMGFQHIVGPVRKKQAPLFDENEVERFSASDPPGDPDEPTDDDIDSRYIGVTTLEEALLRVLQFGEKKEAKQADAPAHKKSRKRATISAPTLPAPPPSAPHPLTDPSNISEAAPPI